MKFCFKLKSATETHEMLVEVYRDAAVTRKTVYKWSERFRSGFESIDDEDRPGRPSTSCTDENISRVKETTRSNRRLTIREKADDLNISFGSDQHILTNVLNMNRVSAKFVPRILTPEQKEQRLSISLELRDLVTSDPNFFQNLITGDESWVYGYDPETKVQSSQCKTLNSPRPKKARQSKSSVKVMLIVFFDLEGIVRSEFVPSGTTVNSAYYEGVMERLRNNVRRKRPQKLANDFVLHHDNATCHTSLLIHQFFSDKKKYCVPSSAVFNRFSTLLPLTLSETEIDHEGKAICVDTSD
jgi:histone-lysine N-methyltransferase SETMAR